MSKQFPDRDAKTIPAPNADLWIFDYKRGSAQFTRIVKARNASVALAVAQRWCEHNTVRVLGGRVEPLICADESILDIPAENPSPVSALADPVTATTT